MEWQKEKSHNKGDSQKYGIDSDKNVTNSKVGPIYIITTIYVAKEK